MVSKKGKRKIEYEGKSFYWFVRANPTGIPRIHILSEDKRINLEYPLFDREIPCTPAYVKRLLKEYFEKQQYKFELNCRNIFVKRELFKHFMLAGHGRAFELLYGNEEEFREIVLYGCLNDIAFDMQCEGSRGWYMYNLALQYEDYEYFLTPAIEKFLSADVNTDWHIICHLCDLIDYFTSDNRDVHAKNAIDKKYDELYSLIMTMKCGLKAKKIAESYEYLAITIMQRGDFDRTLQIYKDMGAYFIRRKKADDEDLKWTFKWFFDVSEDEYGEAFVEQQLDESSKRSKEIARFKRIMMAPDRKHTGSPFIFPHTAEEFIEKSEKASIARKDIVHFSRKTDDSEKLKLAQAVLEEKDLNKKTKLLSAFTFVHSIFPMNPQSIIEYAKSDHKALRDTALNALFYLRADCVHDFATAVLEENFSTEVLGILIHNYKEQDKEFILQRLKEMTIDFDDTSGWHGIVMQILHTDDEISLPNEFLAFVYERSLCSCCRERAVEKLKNRNLLEDKIISECKWDCNKEIRSEVENLNQI